jgi:hypothetical protein
VKIFNKNQMYCLVIAISMVLVSFTIQYNVSLNIWDEGYVWYGSQRTLLGDVPLLDFLAYDPGRYYWTAAIMKLLDDNGIIALRLAIALFQMVGISLALYCIAITCKSEKIKFLLVVFSAILILWMIPRHKLFDITLSIISFTSLLFYLNKTTYKNIFILGCVIGLVAFFGRNHGVYGFIASIFIIIYDHIVNMKKNVFKKILFFIFGVITGFSPMLLMMILIPDFYHAFLNSILFILE